MGPFSAAYCHRSLFCCSSSYYCDRDQPGLTDSGPEFGTGTGTNVFSVPSTGPRLGPGYVQSRWRDWDHAQSRDRDVSPAEPWVVPPLTHKRSACTFLLLCPHTITQGQIQLYICIQSYSDTQVDNDRTHNLELAVQEWFFFQLCTRPPGLIYHVGIFTGNFCSR